MSDWYQYEAAPSKAKRIESAQKKIAKLTKKGHVLDPAKPNGQKIAKSFWGQSWNRNLERYAVYETRLPRGRSYLRAEAVLDLKIERGVISALVLGSELYTLSITIKPLKKDVWAEIKEECAGQVSNLLDLLQGKLPEAVLATVTREENGLFPKPKEISFNCDCPDYADLCKHAAAALYGVGARLDRSPEMLFELRGVDHTELLGVATETVADLTDMGNNPFSDTDLSSMFGIELDTQVKEEDLVDKVLKEIKTKTSVAQKAKTSPKKAAKKAAKKTAKPAAKKPKSRS